MPFISKNWPRVSALLDMALELPAEQRISWIESATIETAEIKSQVSALLTDTAPADALLCKSPDLSAALLEEAQRCQQIEIELQPDRLIGSYRLLRELGRGGMGAVWLAQRVDGKFKREVALKFPYAGPRQRELTERLIRERNILARLEHPNIARLYDADVTASGQPFLVLEYIDGIAINEYCDQHRLDIRQRLTLFQQVLSAVRYAHAHLVIHRDLKPSNILISDDGMVHLLDFGIATSIAEGAAHQTPLTQFGGHVLTPEYASPEQVTGETLTTACDIYVLGVVLYQLLTGTLPYRWQRDRRTQLEEAVVNADVIVPSRVAISNEVAACRDARPAQLHNTLRGELDALLSKTLKKSPEQRYASVDALTDDIARYLENKPILAQPDSEWYRVRKFVSRNRVAVASVTTIALALIIGIGIALWQAHEASLQRDRAVASAARSEAVSDFLQLMVTDVADANEPITMQQLIARSEDIANRSYVGDANQQAAILEVLGSYYVRFNHAEKANEAFGKALAIEEKNSDHAMRAKLLCSLAIAQFMAGKGQLAEQNIATGMLLAHDDPYVEAVCLDNRASLKSVNEDLRGELDDLGRAQEQLLKSGINKPALSLSIMTDLANVYSDLGRSDDAERFYTMAAKLLTQLGREETSSAIDLQHGWGLARANLGDQLGALQHENVALEIARKRGISVDRDTGFDVSRALMLHQLARDDEAIAIYRRVIEHAQKDGAVLMVVYTKQAMAQSLLAHGHISEVQKIIDQIVPMIGKEIPDHGMYAVNMLGIQGTLAMKQHRYQIAVRSYSKFIDAVTAIHLSRTYLSSVLTMRGKAYLAEKEFAAALADATAAWDNGHSAQGNFPYSNASGKAALLLAKIHNAKNEKDDALKWATTAFHQLQGSVGADHPDTLEAKQLLDSLQPN